MRCFSCGFRVSLALLALAAGLPGSVLAWGPTGHRAIGRIAERHLTPEAAREVSALLAPEQLTFVTTWADEIRPEPEWAKADSWHWVTIPDGHSYESADKNPKGDILEAIARFEKTLADRQAPRLERVQALKWLAHLIGDLHQPLHVGRGDDRGGGDVLVLWFNEPSDLHWVWDSKFIESSQLSFTELVELLDHATLDEVRALQAGRASDWAQESRDLRGACYQLGNKKLSFQYVHDHWPTVKRRLLEAGLRLAGELNRLLAPR